MDIIRGSITCSIGIELLCVEYDLQTACPDYVWYANIIQSEQLNNSEPNEDCDNAPKERSTKCTQWKWQSV